MPGKNFDETFMRRPLPTQRPLPNTSALRFPH
jgi:hypothetical protein